VFPVCSPELCHGPHPLREPADLEHHTLLHYPCLLKDHVYTDWASWLSLASVSNVDGTRGLSFYPGPIAIEAAVAGNGVALGKGIVVADDLANGRLIRPFDIDVGLRCEHHLVYPRVTARQPSHRAFRAWLKEELQATSGALATLRQADTCVLA
jgi:LysR family glycine cleavage system transcriptional activator